VSSSVSTSVTIVGGGISGLSAAFFLLKAGIRPLIIEKTSRLGGLIHTDVIDGCELEAGPDSFIAAKPHVASLAAELGIESEIIGSNDAARRIFIAKGGSLVPMPSGMVLMVPGDLDAAIASDFFSPATKERFQQELQFIPRARQTDISVRELILDHFGEENLEYLAEPLLSGVYGGDVAELSARSVLPRFLEYESKFGSLIRGVRQERAAPRQHGSLFVSFRGGMQSLTDTLQRSVLCGTEMRHAEVHKVEKTAHGWFLHLDGEHIQSENLVLACPAHVSARLLRNACPQLAAQLASIPYSSALLVTLVYERCQLGHPLDGFGFLVPRPERHGVAAATWIGTKFPLRVPGNRAALRAFIVGADAIEWGDREDADLIELVRNEFARLMGISASPLFSIIYRWPKSMPQYTVGHEARKTAIAELTEAEAGLIVCGNAYDGVGIPDCVRLAREVPAKILSRDSTDVNKFS
jgi:protoporphyrinogen/coproporphyrinogen III oxidase